MTYTQSSCLQSFEQRAAWMVVLCQFYLGSWRHLSVKIFRSRCIVKTFRDQSYIYMEAIYQISAQSETWIDTVSEGEVLAPFT